MTDDGPPITWRERVRDEWTDYNGHMNLAYYVLVFDHATDVFYDSVGLGRAYRDRTNCSTFAVESHVTYDAEFEAGAEVVAAPASWASTRSAFTTSTPCTMLPRASSPPRPNFSGCTST
jgi:hypothetical protein